MTSIFAVSHNPKREQMKSVSDLNIAWSSSIPTERKLQQVFHLHSCRGKQVLVAKAINFPMPF